MIKFTRKQLQERYNYDPETGIVTWKKDTHNMKAGTIMGGISWRADGSIQMKLRGYPMNRVIWYMVTGEWPGRGMRVSFVDGDPTNMRWENLRLLTHQQVMLKKRKRANTSSQFRGVSWRPKDRRWGAQCAGKYLGSYKDEIEAARAYDAAAKRIFGPHANLNFNSH